MEMQWKQHQTGSKRTSAAHARDAQQRAPQRPEIAIDSNVARRREPTEYEEGAGTAALAVEQQSSRGPRSGPSTQLTAGGTPRPRSDANRGAPRRPRGLTRWP